MINVVGVIILVITTTKTITVYWINGPMEHVHNIHKNVNTIQQQLMLVLVFVVYVSWSKGYVHKIHHLRPYYLPPHPRLNVISAHL
jgi:choline-glycine betaine transporter